MMRGARMEFYPVDSSWSIYRHQSGKVLICGLSNGAFIVTTYSSIIVGSPVPNVPSRTDPIIAQLLTHQKIRRFVYGKAWGGRLTPRRLDLHQRELRPGAIDRPRDPAARTVAAR